MQSKALPRAPRPWGRIRRGGRGPSHAAQSAPCLRTRPGGAPPPSGCLRLSLPSAPLLCCHSGGPCLSHFSAPPRPLPSPTQEPLARGSSGTPSPVPPPGPLQVPPPPFPHKGLTRCPHQGPPLGGVPAALRPAAEFVSHAGPPYGPGARGGDRGTGEPHSVWHLISLLPNPSGCSPPHVPLGKLRHRQGRGARGGPKSLGMVETPRAEAGGLTDPPRFLPGQIPCPARPPTPPLEGLQPVRSRLCLRQRGDRVLGQGNSRGKGPGQEAECGRKKETELRLAGLGPLGSAGLW